MSASENIKEQLKARIVEKNKFVTARYHMLWIFMGGSLMAFTVLSLVYVAFKAADFEMPGIFWASTGVLIVSGALLEGANRAAAKDNFTPSLRLLMACLLLLMIFSVMQVRGWRMLNAVYENSPEYWSNYKLFIALSAFHLLHLLAGIVWVTLLVVQTLKMEVHSKKNESIRYGTIYHRFLTAVWLLLMLLF